MRPRRRVPSWLYAVLFPLVALLELYVMIRVGQQIGVGWTILLLVAGTLIGAWLVKREGARAFRAFNEAVADGRMPARELADALLVLAGGVLIILPGFVLDAVGLFLVLPFTRPIARKGLTAFVAARVVVPPGFGPASGEPAGAPGSTAYRDDNRPRPESDGPVVEGEVVDED